MSEYLTKEEIRQWRSSLERITLEEYAARLGKLVQGEKQTNDMIDKVMTSSLNSMQNVSEYTVHTEKLQTITLKSMFEHKEPVQKVKKEEEHKKVKEIKDIKTVKAAEKETEKTVEPIKIKEEGSSSVSETAQSSDFTFKKPLIPREQMIFDFLLKNKGSIVYAKDMAALLELPRDYVYKYIKNLRQKLNEDVLFNADNGGYILKV